jgi:hypothetical protein
MGCGASAGAKLPGGGAGEGDACEDVTCHERESTLRLEQKIAEARSDPARASESFRLQNERNARRKTGKLDGVRARTGYAGNIRAC